MPRLLPRGCTLLSCAAAKRWEGMIVCKLVGWTLLAAALAVIGWELWSWWETGALNARTAGELWFQLDVSSLNGFQVLIQRHLEWPSLWDDWIVPVLSWPAWLLLLVPALVLTVLCRNRKRRYWFLDK